VREKMEPPLVFAVFALLIPILGGGAECCPWGKPIITVSASNPRSRGV